MEVIDRGHTYLLDDNKSTTKTNTLVFYKDIKINNNGYNGTTNQEVLRALIDRINFLNEQVPDKINKDIIYHLRKALILHEQRHLDRLLEKGYPIENLKKFKDGHIVKCFNIKNKS